MNQFAPIVLFVFNRPDHTQQTLDALALNPESKSSILYIYCDGAKQNSSKSQLEKVLEVREIAKSEKRFAQVHIIEQEKNLGLAQSIILGVTEIINKYEKVIVLEDDIKVERGFLKYMNDSLNIYQNHERVYHISGFNNESNFQWILPKLYFLHFMSCWGWATWRNKWSELDCDFQRHLDLVKNSKTYYNQYNYDGKINHHIQLSDNINGKIKTWAILWYSTIMKHNGLCLTPKYSLVENIGMDGSGVHCSQIYVYKKKYSTSQEIQKEHYPKKYQESKLGKFHLKLFFQYGQKGIMKILRQKIGTAIRIIKTIEYKIRKPYLFENINKNKKWAGDDYGGFYVCPDNLNEKTNILSFGIGENVSFDDYLIENYNCKVYGFDPTEKSIFWVQNNYNRKEFQLLEYGLSNSNEIVDFYLPSNPEYVSGSISNHGGTSKDKVVKVELKNYNTILNELKIQNVDVLKMDIEGAEYKVIQDILSMPQHKLPSQILVEFHDRFYPEEKNKSHKTLKMLYNKGYRIFGISKSQQEISLINTKLS